MFCGKSPQKKYNFALVSQKTVEPILAREVIQA